MHSALASEETMKELRQESKRMRTKAEKVRGDASLAAEAFEECAGILEDAAVRVQFPEV